MTNTDSFVGLLVRVMNFFLLLRTKRKGSNFRFAETFRDARSFAEGLAKGQFFKIYGRITAKYNYHPLQQFENSIRKFDLSASLDAELRTSGNAAFYRTVCGESKYEEKTNYSPDLTRLSDLTTVKTSADYLFRDILNNNENNTSAAAAARDAYARGFSRVINTQVYGDWEAFRRELRNREPSGATADSEDDGVLLIALSYKGKSTKITRRMQILKEDGSPEDESIYMQFGLDMTEDFLDDFRWSQVVRSCNALALAEGKSKVRLWIDRYVMMGMTKGERTELYNKIDWADFGLFPYAVCHVVRIYEPQEPFYGTDFWRKLETVLGVAGKGLLVDDYMLRKYDKTIYFGAQIYTRLAEGLSRIGGDGIYLRCTTLALATALLTDGVSVSAANEDVRTTRAIGGWKAWALRTIAEGVYSSSHRSMLCEERPFQIRLQDFRTLTFWESIVSKSNALVGKSYLDMSLRRSTSWRKGSGWDGVLEWVGMLGNSCEIVERDAILQFISQRVSLDMYAATSGHVAGIMTAISEDGIHKKAMALELSRFSTPKRGHITAVAEATGLWERRVLPWYLRHFPDPDKDQKVKHDSLGTLIYTCKPMKVGLNLPSLALIMWAGLFILVIIGFSQVNKLPGFPRFVAVVFLLVIGGFAVSNLLRKCFPGYGSWPWVDKSDAGEGIFDNLLLHALFGSGIKNVYRKMRINDIRYSELGWV